MKGTLFCLVFVFASTQSSAHKVYNSAKSFNPSSANKLSNSAKIFNPKVRFGDIYKAYLDLREKVVSCEKQYVCSAFPKSLTSTTLECLPNHMVCDGKVDCDNGVDEMGCIPTTTTTVGPIPFSCKAGEYRCQLIDKCINVTHVCNDVVDCTGGDDENACPGSCFCEPGSYVCAGNNKCIPQEEVCDGQFDCPNEDDEPSGCRCTFGTSGLPDFCADAGSGEAADLLLVNLVVPFDNNLANCQELCRKTPICQAVIIDAEPDIQCALVTSSNKDAFVTPFNNFVPGTPCSIQFYKKNCQ